MTKATQQEIQKLVNEAYEIYVTRSGEWANTSIFEKVEKIGIHAFGWGGNINTEYSRIHALKNILIRLKELTQ